MERLRFNPAAICILTASSLAAAVALAQQPTPESPTLAENYGKLPLSFEANQGQTNSQVKFLSKGNGYGLFLTNKSAVLALTKSGKASPSRPNQSGCTILTDRAVFGKPCESEVDKGGDRTKLSGLHHQNRHSKNGTNGSQSIHESRRHRPTPRNRQLLYRQ